LFESTEMFIRDHRFRRYLLPLTGYQQKTTTSSSARAGAGGNRLFGNQSSMWMQLPPPPPQKFFPLSKVYIVEDEHHPYDVPRAYREAVMHLKSPVSDGVASSEYIWLATTMALKKLVKENKIKLRTHAAINALFEFVVEEKVPTKKKKLIEYRYYICYLLHQNFYDDFASLATVNSYAAEAEKLIPLFKRVKKIDGGKFLDFCRKKNLHIIEKNGWTHVKGWKKREQ